ncbi:MAG TPA: tetratricopeptide repeat protein [Polyangiaceae bacterium]|nr:tetratricopeptide repeat protein [Polyangiaceae bacterium]
MTQNQGGGTPNAGQAASLQLKGGAAIVAPATAFPGGIPANALIVVPVTKPSEDLEKQLAQGPFAVTQEQMWALLGFNGPAVQVQDGEGRPITIGLDDLLQGLREHWQENKSDLSRGRAFASELMKYRRFEEAEKVSAKIVAQGGGGEDWLSLGVAQLQQEKFDIAEGTLKGARNLLPENPFPSLHLAKCYKGQGKPEEERAAIEHAISVQPNSVDAWAVLFVHVRDAQDQEAAIKAITELADAETNKKSAAPFVALQGIFAGQEETRNQALTFAQKAIERNPSDPLALISLSALLGQAGRIDEIVNLLAPHEPAMTRDVRLAHNYFEALMHKRDIGRVTTLLNKLAASSNKEVKQFAIERSRLVAQVLQQQQQQVARASTAARSGLVGPDGKPLS